MPLYHGRKKHFVHTGMDTLSRYKFSVTECNAFVKLSPVHLQNALPTVMVSHTALLLIKELTSQEMKSGSGPRLMDFGGLTYLVPQTH